MDELVSILRSTWKTRAINTAQYGLSPTEVPGGTEVLRVIALARDSTEFQSLVGIELTLLVYVSPTKGRPMVLAGEGCTRNKWQ
jgi:hypothetical protein